MQNHWILKKYLEEKPTDGKLGGNVGFGTGNVDLNCRHKRSYLDRLSGYYSFTRDS